MKQKKESMKSEELKPYLNKTYPSLERQAVRAFNNFIRWRDSREIKDAFICISCRDLKSVTKMHAGHFYSSGHYSILKFDEDNVHGQCERCNHFLSGNLNEYRQHLERKIGKDRLLILDQKSKVRAHRIDRWTLIEIILTYKNKLTKQKNDLEKNHLCGSISHNSTATGSVQSQRSKLFQSQGDNLSTGKQIRWKKGDE
jgi:hypothetical protein